MRIFALMLCFVLLLQPTFSAEFSIDPYLYSGETASMVETTIFTSNNSTAKLLKIDNEEIMLVVDDKIIEDRGQIKGLITEYYKKNFYASDEELKELKGFADDFNDSRNYKTRYGPVEYVCYTSGTFLAHIPCHDMGSCIQTASTYCAITGAQGCIVDLLATHILEYKNDLDKLNSAYEKFDIAYTTFSPETASLSLDNMDDAFNEMKDAADSIADSKLRFPETTSCMDCIGVCPEAHFDYGAISSGKSKVAQLREKIGPLASLGTAVDRILLSTEERIKYREGEEKALIFEPKYEAVKTKFEDLKAQAVEAKALVADKSFVDSADLFLDKAEELEQRVLARDFDGFNPLLSSYETAGWTLAAKINNSTSAYKTAFETQDDAGDKVLLAQWGVNRLSPASVDSYNSLAKRKNTLDSDFDPPMTSAQYYALSSNYDDLASDAQAFVAASGGIQDSIFGAGNAISRDAIDGTMTLASNIMPVSFKTRKEYAPYILPFVIAVVDLSLLSVGLLAFAAVFYYFHGFFKSKLAVSGWAISMLAFVFIMLIGSAGIYAVVFSTESYTDFVDFMGTVKASNSVAVIVDESGVPSGASDSMKACAGQIQDQLDELDKQTLKYYINTNKCTSIIPKPSANNSSETVYETLHNLVAEDCLDSIPDIPVIELRYSSENKVPSFTTVVTQQAIFKGNAAYYDKAPMCDPANVLN